MVGINQLAEETAEEQSAEDAMAVLGVKLEDVLRELEYRRQKRVERALVAQRRAAKENGARRIMRGPDGNGGEFQMQVHPEFYHYWGQRLGYACWRDDQFVSEFLRDNPECRVKTVSDRTTIVKPEYRVRGRRGRWAA